MSIPPLYVIGLALTLLILFALFGKSTRRTIRTIKAFRRHQFGDGTSVFRDHDFFSILYGVQQFAQAVFCFEGADSAHGFIPVHLAASSL